MNAKEARDLVWMSITLKIEEAALNGSFYLPFDFIPEDFMAELINLGYKVTMPISGILGSPGKVEW